MKKLTSQSLNHGPKDWPEDFSHENGNYLCRCTTCGSEFTGHKRRVTCKECLVPTTDAGNIAGTPLTDACCTPMGVRGELFVSRDFARDLEAQLTKSREATAKAERERDDTAAALQRLINAIGTFQLCGVGELRTVDDVVTAMSNVAGKLEAVNLRAELATARAERDGRETDLMIALKDLAEAQADKERAMADQRRHLGSMHDETLAELERVRKVAKEMIEERDASLAAETAKNAELAAQFGRIGEMIGDPLGGDFCQLESAIRDMAVFTSAVMERTGCATEEGAIEWIEGAKTNESDLLKAAEERDALRTELAEARKSRDDYHEMSKQSDAYVRKLANLLGCTDGDDSPELGIKDLIADRAELREKLAIAVECAYGNRIRHPKSNRGGSALKNMTAHEFARMLLQGPDLQILTPRVVEYSDDEEDNMRSPSTQVVIGSTIDDEPIRILVISYGGGTNKVFNTHGFNEEVSGNDKAEKGAGE